LPVLQNGENSFCSQ